MSESRDSLRELIFTLNDYRNNNVDTSGQPTGNSIFRKAAPAILQFPIIVSDGVSLEDLTMINKALEREYSTIIRLAMGLDDILDDEHGTKSKIDYIKKFHTNNYSSANSNVLELIENVNKENLIVVSEDTVIEVNDKALLRESLGLNMTNLNDLTNKNYRQYINLSEAKKDDGLKTTKVEYEYEIGRSKQTGKLTPYVVGKKEIREIDKNKDTFKGYSNYSSQLVDNDIKKANELIPTTLDITVYHKVGEKVIEDHILLGVKCVSHKVSGQEMIDNITDTIEKKRPFFRFIQWTTGEIKFFKDYLLCLDNLKKEALKSRSKDKSALYFKELKNRATISKLKSAFNLKNQLIPNSTIVMTMDEVDFIRNNYNIDLIKDIDTVNELIKTYFLVGFVIVDSASEIVYFKFDGIDKYQMFTYSSLERENRNQGNDIKALVSLMSKY